MPPLQDGAGLRVGTAGRVLIQVIADNQAVDLTPGSRSVTVDCKLNGGALGGVSPTSGTKVSIDGVETAGASGWYSIDFTGANLNFPGTLTIEHTIGGTPTVNPNAKPIRIPVRAAHADAT